MNTLSAATTMLFVWTVNALCLAGPQTANPVTLSETYELANIILALTDYGKSDPWEVEKQSAYYAEVQSFFAAHASHPLLKKVNYSREKWESYLSFRTDAYAFAFNTKGRLMRTTSFNANEGFNCFEENLVLITDFVRVTHFRKFYKDHLSYYRSLASQYLKTQHYTEMLAFLSKEFGSSTGTNRYAIAISPLVGRMNCHREVKGILTDFITLPSYLLSNKVPNTIAAEEEASGTHMLFTELDHGFVNPVTWQYRKLVTERFSINRWDTGSGYETDSLATFNEYMTWGLYDIFIRSCFPDVDTTVCIDWALQNETRGFYASTLFNRELLTLYKHRQPGQTIKDLYPALLQRLAIIQGNLVKPTILACNIADKTLTDTVAQVTIQFSEPMREVAAIHVVRVTGTNGKQRLDKLEITTAGNGLAWSNNGTTIRFSVPLINHQTNQLVFNYAWKAYALLVGKNGVNLAPYTRVKTSVETIP
jgi:hypothetical protein